MLHVKYVFTYFVYFVCYLVTRLSLPVLFFNCGWHLCYRWLPFSSSYSFPAYSCPFPQHCPYSCVFSQLWCPFSAWDILSPLDVRSVVVLVTKLLCSVRLSSGILLFQKFLMKVTVSLNQIKRLEVVMKRKKRTKRRMKMVSVWLAT